MELFHYPSLLYIQEIISKVGLTYLLTKEDVGGKGPLRGFNLAVSRDLSLIFDLGLLEVFLALIDFS